MRLSDAGLRRRPTKLITPIIDPLLGSPKMHSVISRTVRFAEVTPKSLRSREYSGLGSALHEREYHEGRRA
jgi:hypothetical protein